MDYVDHLLLVDISGCINMLLQKPGFCGSDDEFGCAVWLARVSNHGIVEIYTASRHMWDNPASGSPVAVSYLTRDVSDSLRVVSRIKQNCLC
jgi:hypothetical protein